MNACSPPDPHVAQGLVNSLLATTATGMVWLADVVEHLRAAGAYTTHESTRALLMTAGAERYDPNWWAKPDDLSVAGELWVFEGAGNHRYDYWVALPSSRATDAADKTRVVWALLY